MVLTTKVYVEHTESTSYNTHINQSTSDYHRDKKLAYHEVLIEEWQTYFDAKEGIGEKIQYALDLPY